MTEVYACTMVLQKQSSEICSISCIPFEKKYWEEYRRIYNECFFPMRKALEIEPFNYYSEYSQMEKNVSHTFLYMVDGEIAGSAACFDNEIDDLIVNPKYRKQGIGRQLVLWAVQYIRSNGYEDVILHAAEWNTAAIRLYESVGFKVTERFKVR